MYDLLTLINRMEQCFLVNICVHDISGFSFHSKALALPHERKSHFSPYCAAAKKCIGVENCILQKQKVMATLKRNGLTGFYGICPMGVCEYVHPVVKEQHLLAVVFVSGNAEDDSGDAQAKLVRRIAPLADEQQAAILEAFRLQCERPVIRKNVLTFLAEMVGEFILNGLESIPVDNPEWPDSYPAESVRSKQSPLVLAMLDYIAVSMKDGISLHDMSAVFLMSAGYLQRLFHRETGLSIIDYVKKARVKKAAFLLRTTSLTIAEIAESVGILDPNYFSRMFRSVMGISPSAYRTDPKQAP